MELLAFGKTGWGYELFIATLMTIAVSITAMLIGFSFAAIFTPLKLSKFKSLNLIANIYTTVIRGVPELLVIHLFFFGGSSAIMFVDSIFGYYDYIEDFIEDMKKVFPTLEDDWGIYIPEVKYLSPEPLVNYNDLSLTTYPNVHFVGDALSARGITVSGAQGTLVAEQIINKN